MAGPSLQLGVNAAGQDTLLGLNTQLLKLRENLAALKTGGKVDLGTLSGANTELKRLRADLAEQSASLRTAFTDLSESVKAGFSKTTQEVEEGGKKTRSLVARERQLLQAEYEKDILARKQHTQDQLIAMKEAGVRLTVADEQIAAARRVANASNRVALGGGSFSNPLPVPAASIAGETEISAAYKAHQKLMAEEAAATRAANWIKAQAEADAQIERAQVKGFAGFVAMEQKLAAERKAASLASAKADATGIAKADAYAEFAIRREAAINAAGRMESEAIRAYITRIETATGTLSSARQLALEAEARATFEWRRQVEADSLLNAEAIGKAVTREVDALLLGAERIAKAEALYRATPTGQVRKTLNARAQLDTGIPQTQVAQQFGSSAVAAAQEVSNLSELQANVASRGIKELAPAHDAAASAASKHKSEVVGLGAAMNDLHSASRGVASGFNAMWLTWGNIAPLLAGAAFSNAFVKTVKEGAEVQHQMALIKVLADEDQVAVDGLNKQLLDMASNGIFGPQKIAEAFKNLTLAGLSIKEQRTAIGDVVNFAIAGTTSIEQASESLVQISTAFGYNANGFGRVGDIISKAAAISLSSVESLTRSMQSASEVHILYGQSLVDVATNLAVLSQLGIRGTAAGTALKNMYAELSGSTSIVRRNIQAYNLDVLDQNGKVKDLLPLLETLGDKYNELKGSAQTRFTQDLSNTRGGKDLVALLTEFNKSSATADNNPRLKELEKETPEVAKLANQYRLLGERQKETFLQQQTDRTGNATLSSNIAEYAKIVQESRSKLADTRKQIEESYGFAAVAAATLAVTAKSQMESVSASFQASLVKSFSAIEPAVLSISSKLRGIFNSAEFQATVQNLATAVANVGVFLVEHARLIAQIIEAYVVWKAATIGLAVLQAVWQGLSSAWALATTAVTAHTAASAANTAALRANAASAEADALAIQAETLASRNGAVAEEARAVALNASTAAAERSVVANEAAAVASKAAGTAAMGVGSLLLRALPVIGTVALIASSAMDIFWNSASGKDKSKDVADAFDEKYRQINEKLKQQAQLSKSNFEALAGISGPTQAAEAQALGKQTISELAGEVDKRGEAVKAAQAKLDQQNREVASLSNQAGQYDTGVLGVAAIPSTQAAEQELATAQSRYDTAKGLLADAKQNLGLVKDYSKLNAELADEQAKLKQPKGTLDTPTKPDLGLANAELSSLKREYKRAEDEAKRHADAMDKILKAQHAGGLISDIEFQIEEEARDQELYNKRLAALDNYIEKSQRLLATLRSDPKNKGQIKAADTEEEQLFLERKNRDTLVNEKAVRDAQKLGAENKQEQDISKFISQRMQELVIDRETLETRQKLDTLTNDERVIEEARIAAKGKFNDKIREEQLLLANVQIYLEKLEDQRSQLGPGETDKGLDLRVERARAEEARLQGAVTRLRETQVTAGEFAAESIATKLKPQWQQMLDGWKNVLQLMTTAYDTMVQGFIEQGEVIWDRLIKTGKLSAGELITLVRDTVAKTIYQQTLAPAFAQLGQKVAGVIFGDRAKPGNVGSPVDLAAQSTAANLELMSTTGVLPATNALEFFTAAVSRAGGALGVSAVDRQLNIGGLGGWFGGGYTGGGSAGFQGSQGGIDFSGIGAPFRDGDVFGGPTLFRFGNGGSSLGIMGEAGEEAVMPLKRNSRGQLGVMYANAPPASSGGGNVSVVVENHSGSQAQVRETRKSNGDREIRVLIDAAKSAVVESIHSGGEVGNAIETQYGLNRTAGLPRR